MATTKKVIREWLERYANSRATHLVIVCDTFSYEDFVQSRKILFVAYVMSHLRFFEKALKFIIKKKIKVGSIVEPTPSIHHPGIQPQSNNLKR